MSGHTTQSRRLKNVECHWHWTPRSNTDKVTDSQSLSCCGHYSSHRQVEHAKLTHVQSFIADILLPKDGHRNHCQRCWRREELRVRLDPKRRCELTQLLSAGAMAPRRPRQPVRSHVSGACMCGVCGMHACVCVCVCVCCAISTRMLWRACTSIYVFCVCATWPSRE